MLFHSYKTFIKWQYLRIWCCIFSAASLYALAPSLLRLNPQIFTADIQKGYMALPVVLFSLSLSLGGIGNRKFLQKGRRPPPYHPIWTALRKLRRSKRISVRLDPNDSFGMIGLGILKMHRIILYIPNRGSRRKRDYTRRAFTFLLPSLAHELGHVRHAIWLFLTRLLLTAFELSCSLVACIYFVNVILSSYPTMTLSRDLWIAILIAYTGILIRVLRRTAQRSFEYLADSEIYSLLGTQGVKWFVEDMVKYKKNATLGDKIFEFFYSVLSTHPSARARIRALQLIPTT